MRAGYERLEAVGDKGTARPWRAVLAEALYQLDRHEEAEQFADIAIALGSADDVATQAQARAVKAKLLAAKRDFDGAERVAREAVEHSNDADDLDMRAYVLMSVAEVLRLAGTTMRRRLPSRRPPMRATERAMSSGRRTLARDSLSSTPAPSSQGRDSAVGDCASAAMVRLTAPSRAPPSRHKDRAASLQPE